jgi:peptidoglycan/LPS O-acetylase OafA/YrhL
MTDLHQAAETIHVRSRTAALDGIRGIAIVLVVISHGWALWSMDRIIDTPLVSGLFTSGNFAVSIFFVIGGYLAMRGMLAEVELSGRPTPRDMTLRVVRRAVRTGSHSYALLVFVMLAAVLDASEVFSEKVTRDSVWHVMTFTFNWMIRGNAYTARPDLGHLWYICVDLQVFVMLVVLVRFLGHRRIALLATLLGITVLVVWWRAYSISHETPFSTSLRTTTRMDGLVWGAALATAMPYLQRFARAATGMVWGSVLLLVVLMFSTLTADDYYRQNGVLINVGLVVFVLGTSYGVEAAPLNALTWKPLQGLGRMSLAIYVWHYPIFWAVARWNTYYEWGWDWVPKTLLAFALTGLFAVAAQRLVEQPVQRWLARSR